MTATLTFSLPEEEAEYNFAINGFQYFNALDEIRNHLRQKVKYENLKAVELKLFQDMYQKFFEILTDNKIFLE